ncbi:hypothetical protein [Campylobacter sputorum]|uniref:hypothetical protein n=1 Tax=Campylobacter sputorum TaxID=206 RepID=UPI00053BFA30|nr:hypothetical protein [Campylobacter sputorum]
MSKQKYIITHDSIKHKAVWNLKETAFYLGVAETTLRNLVKSGSVPYFRLNENGQYKFYAKKIINLTNN